LNNSKIEWTDKTWGIVTGCRGPDGDGPCSYCYACRMMERFRSKVDPGELLLSDVLDVQPGGKRPSLVVLRKKPGAAAGHWPYGMTPTYHRYRLREPLDSKSAPGTMVFVCSMGDLFGGWVPETWLTEILAQPPKRLDFIFQFLTKNPARYKEIAHLFTRNCWIGTSVTGDSESVDIGRLVALGEAEFDGVKFVSVEPLRGRLDPATLVMVRGLRWVIIGAQTGAKPVVPERGWVNEIVSWCKARDVSVFLKDNLLEYLDDDDPLRQYREWPSARSSVELF